LLEVILHNKAISSKDNLAESNQPTKSSQLRPEKGLEEPKPSLKPKTLGRDLGSPEESS